MIGEPLTIRASDETEFDIEILLAEEKILVSLSKNISKDLSKRIFELVKPNNKGQICWETLMAHFECTDGTQKQLMKKIRDHVYNKNAKQRKNLKQKQKREASKIMKLLFMQKFMP